MHLMVDVQPAPLALVIEVINGWSGRVRRESGEDAHPYPDIAALCTAHGVEAPAVTDEHLVALADHIHPVFAGATADERRNALNVAVRDLAPVPQQSAEGPVWSGIDPRRRLEAGLLSALMEHARDDPGLTRLGACEADRCVDAYLDASQAGTRRFCSLTCQNRARVAAFRHRARAAQHH